MVKIDIFLMKKKHFNKELKIRRKHGGNYIRHKKILCMFGVALGQT